MPLHQLTLEPGSLSRWRSSGDDPFFELQGGGRLSGGWVHGRITIRADDSASLSTALYVNRGEGYSEETRISLPEPRNGRIDVIFRLPDPVVSLRFDPADGPCEFDLGAIELREIGGVEGGFRLFARCVAKRVKNWRDAAALAKKLRDAYANGGFRAIGDFLLCAEMTRDAFGYADWIAKYGRLSEYGRELIRTRIERLERRPRISVVMPVYNTDPRWLRESIASVQNQLYPEWELCISDDASTLPGTRETLSEYEDKDARIKLFFRETNGHISANSNSALALASGEFVAFLDADDVLSDDALYWVAEEINAHPDADLVFSDEDKIDVEGRRFDPYFKPDWNPALMLSQNFFCHLGVYRRSLVAKLGGFRLGFEGSQDHDLVLRCADASEPSRIRHIPRILYHWRAIPGSTASPESADAKPYAWRAGARAIEEHLLRNGIAGRVLRAGRIYYQVDYPPPRETPKVSIVMPSACRLDLLRPCMTALFERTTYPNFEVLLGINEIRFRNPEQAAYLRELEKNDKVRLLVYEDREFNYSWVNNWAAAQATGSIYCLMNDDIEIVTPDWLEKVVARLQLDNVGAVGVMLHFPNDSIQHVGVTLGLGGVAGHTFIHQPKGSTGYFGRAALEQDLSCVTAACMGIRREAFQDVGGLYEKLEVAFNDVDFCIRLREEGWRILWTPQVAHYHHESATLGRHNSPERMAKFQAEVALMRELWGATLDSDPFHNPNLSLYDHSIGLAFPPRISRTPAASLPAAALAG